MTKQEAVENHRKMWNWIADQIEQEKHSQPIAKLKEKYITRNYKGNVLSDCFCCQYDYEHDECESCAACPIDWWPEGNCWVLYPLCCDSIDYDRQAEYARVIANLPEREDV